MASPTPKQKALLEYLGLPVPADRAAASSRIDGALSDERLSKRLANWRTDKLILHPDIYAEELAAMAADGFWAYELQCRREELGNPRAKNKNLRTERNSMGIIRVILCILFPPLAVLDKGCGALLLVSILTCFAWIPGVIAALVICTRQEPVIIIDGKQVAPQSSRSRHTLILGIFLFLLFCALASSVIQAFRSARERAAGQQTLPVSATPAPSSLGPIHPAKESSAQAVKMYPALGIQGSEFNRRFLKLHEELKDQNAPELTMPGWPMLLAHRVADSLRTNPPKP